MFTEEAIPSDFDLIDKSYDFDTELKRYTPTVEFAKYAFNKLNSEIFESKLPINKVTFKTKSFSEVIKDALGCVIPNERGKSGYIWKYDLYLNTNIKLSIHRWYEVVLHEMFHIYEDECFPENKTKPKYDPPPHGEWFSHQCEKAKQYGFNVSSTFNGDFDMDDEKQTNESYDECQNSDDEHMREIRRIYGDSLIFVKKTNSGYKYGIL